MKVTLSPLIKLLLFKGTYSIVVSETLLTTCAIALLSEPTIFSPINVFVSRPNPETKLNHLKLVY